MNNSDKVLPSNKKFGFFFSGLFCCASFYFFYYSNFLIFYVFATSSLCFLMLSFTFPNILYPFNKLWMKFGYFLGRIISPIILGVIYFLLFTPIGLFLRFIKRDELRLKFLLKESYWINRENLNAKSNNFKNQF